MGGDSVIQKVFNRIEKKYLLDERQYQELLKLIHPYMKIDPYGNYTICNLYFDTPNFDLIKQSIEKPIYKEKMRLRSYGIPSFDSEVFLEIKKKYKKVVNKRRITLPLKEAYKYERKNTQIEKEIFYMFDRYGLKPMMFIAYDRSAFFGKEDLEFRITFDQNIRYRTEDLKLELGSAGIRLFKENVYIMEVKSNFSYPLWFTKILSELKLFPTSFSKYGAIYKQIYKEENHYVQKHSYQ